MDTPIAEHRPTRAPMSARIAGGLTPALFADTRQGQQRFWEFFGANIRNANTRLAYVTAAWRFAGHASTRTTQLYNRLPEEVSLDEIKQIHI